MMARSNARAGGVCLDVAAKFRSKVAKMLRNVYNNGCTLRKVKRLVLLVFQPETIVKLNMLKRFLNPSY